MDVNEDGFLGEELQTSWTQGRGCARPGRRHTCSVKEISFQEGLPGRERAGTVVSGRPSLALTPSSEYRPGSLHQVLSAAGGGALSW